MKNIDYEYLFIYISLILAVSIFIIILYGCMFASVKPNPLVFENFFNKDEIDKDLKNTILTILKDYEDKSTVPEENKHLSELIEKIKNDNITITDLKLLIDMLKKSPQIVSTKDVKDVKDVKEDKEVKDDKEVKNDKEVKEIKGV
jgi:hypothetical protein